MRRQGGNPSRKQAMKDTPRKSPKLSRKDYEAALEPMLLELMQVSRDRKSVV